MKTKLFLLSAALLMASISAYGQSPAGMTLKLNTNAPGTGTILRINGPCPATGVPTGGTTITNSLAVTQVQGSTTAWTGTTVDPNVIGGNTYCYWSTFQSTGGGSGVSNTFLGSVTVTVTLSGSLQ